MYEKIENDRPGRLFDTRHLLTNSAITAAGAGAGMAATTGLLWPALLGAFIGGVVGYSLTNDIPSEKN